MPRLLALVGLILLGGALVTPSASAQDPAPPSTTATATTSTTSPSTTTTTPGSAAGDDPDATSPYLSLDQASPWVTSEGTWTATWSVTQEPPADAVVRYTIHQPLPTSDLRTALAEVIAGGDLGPSLHSEEDRPLAQLRTDAKATLTIPIRSHSGSSDRVLVPNAGIMPIGIDLVAADGTRLQHSVLFLDRLPATAAHPALRVAPRAEAVSTPIVAVDGTSSIPAAARTSFDAIIDLLKHQPVVPITANVDPELISGLRHSSDPTDATRVSALREALAGRPVLGSTWSPIDVNSWATSGTLADLQSSLFAGRIIARSVAATKGDAATEDRIWPADPTVGPGALRALSDLGIQHLVLAPNQLEPTKDLGSDPGTTQRVAIDSTDSGLDALVDDPTLTAQLADKTVSSGTSAHLLMTELEAIWFSTSSSVTPAVSLDLTAAPADTAAAVLDALAVGPNPTVSVTTLADAFTAASAYQTTSRRRTVPVVRKLVTPSTTHDIAPLSDYLGKLRARAAAYHSTMADPPGVAPLNDLLLVSQHRSLNDAGDRSYLDAAAHRIDSDLAKIQPPPARSLTLTARKATIPVHIVNGVDRPVMVLLRFRGTRLGLRDGANRVVRLQPGQNSLNVPVVVRTSGEFTMTIQIRTADNSLLLSESTVRIRSTVVSGVGVLLGGGALLFLVIWWGTSIRRDRRARAAAAGAITSPAEEPASVA